MSLEETTSIVVDIDYISQLFQGNISNETPNVKRPTHYNIMAILESIIAIIGIFSNFIVVLAFMHDGNLRIRIPNIFIINQASFYYFYS